MVRPTAEERTEVERRLWERIVALQKRCDRLGETAGSIEAVVAENDTLRQVVATLTQERLRLEREVGGLKDRLATARAAREKDVIGR